MYPIPSSDTPPPPTQPPPTSQHWHIGLALLRETVYILRPTFGLNLSDSLSCFWPAVVGLVVSISRGLAAPAGELWFRTGIWTVIWNGPNAALAQLFMPHIHVCLVVAAPKPTPVPTSPTHSTVEAAVKPLMDVRESDYPMALSDQS